MGFAKLIRRVRPAPLQSSEAAFWSWFVANEPMLHNFLDDVENVVDALAAAIDRVDSDLAFDLGPLADGRRELVVTANGVESAFPAVLRLVAAAPPLPRWTVTAFRPRRDLDGDFFLHCGCRLAIADVRFTAEPVGGRLRVKVLIPGYRPTPLAEFEDMAEFLVSMAVGEFDMQTRLAGVSAGPPRPGAPGRRLAELPALVDALTGE